MNGNSRLSNRRKQANRRQAADDASSLKARLEAKISKLPTSMDDKVVNSDIAPASIVNFLHFFDSESHEQQVFLRECLPLRVLYSQLRETLGDEPFVGEWFDMSQDRIDQFATLTGD